MAGEVPVSKQQWVRYLSRTRNTIALHCSVEGVVTEHNPSARRLFGWHDRLEGKPLAALLHRADHAPLSLAALPVDGDMMPLALVAEDSGKVLQGFFFREPDGVLLLADVIGDGDEVSEQLGVMANEISDISRDLRQRNRELEEANRRITKLSRTGATSSNGSIQPCPSPSGTVCRSPWSWRTSIISSASTTPMAMRPATGCCAPSPTPSAPSAAVRICPAASVARSS